MGASLGVPADRFVMVRPFKILAFEREIRQYLKLLEMKLKGSNGDSTDEIPSSLFANSPIVAESVGQEGVIADKETADHLRCLIEFFDQDLGEDLRVHRELRDGTARMVAFKDLWHLYRPGDIVIEDGAEFQAYRVINVRGGRPFLEASYQDGSSSQSEREVDDSHHAEGSDCINFIVDCIYIDFNGKEFGPVQEVVNIRPFDGQRVITKLFVFPIRFFGGIDKQNELIKRLEIRGQKFRELMDTTKVSHCVYRGLSLVDQFCDSRFREHVSHLLESNSHPG
jgi:hypothetical protein